jgi:hypothetical protein
MTDPSALGEFEHIVLLAVLRLGEGAYAVPILDEIERCTGRRISRGSVYITLDRLEDKASPPPAAGRAIRPRSAAGAPPLRLRRARSPPCARAARAEAPSAGWTTCWEGRAARAVHSVEAPALADHPG